MFYLIKKIFCFILISVPITNSLKFPLATDKVNLNNIYNIWHPASWKTKQVYQNVIYKNQTHLQTTVDELSRSAPLIFAGESKQLKLDLVKASEGNAFVLMGGDCAETFREFSTKNVMDTYRILLQMTLILMYSTSKPIIKIGRMAGQFAKPRSSETEIQSINDINIELPSYRGDIVNFEPFDLLSREPNPDLMLKAYSQSVQTMNLIRALSEGGYADIERIDKWNLDFVKKNNSFISNSYNDLASDVHKAIKFIKATGSNNLESITKAKFYTAHEALLLPYEEALTRVDSTTNKYYDCSAHMIWIGERTRQLDGAHTEFVRGVNNPIGIKISEKCVPHELCQLIEMINPSNEKGKIVVITRMGKYINDFLPQIVQLITRKNLNVVWICDPMHGNTIKLSNGLKTRLLKDIKQEFESFIKILQRNRVYPAGIHLELTGKDVIECLNDENNIPESMLDCYESSCDPRLSASQCLELGFNIADIYNNL